jgi:hypothetical protein
VRLSTGAIACVFALAIASCTPVPQLYVPAGPPESIRLRAAFFVDAVGTWTLDGFEETLSAKLSEYDIHVVDRGPSTVAFIVLGAWTDRVGGGREIDVLLERRGRRARVGRVLVPDLSMATLDVAAEPIALVIARALRGGEPDAAAPGAEGAEAGD